MVLPSEGPKTFAPPLCSRTARARAELCAHLLERHLGRVLKLVDLEVKGKPAKARGFALGKPAVSESTQLAGPRIRYESLLSYARHEPRLELIAKGLQRALRLGTFLGRRGALPADAFRLRDLAQWAHYPVGSLADNVGSISSYCNCDCDFCYEKGTRGAGIAMGRAQLSLRELATRLRFYSPEKRTGLLPSSRFALEPFANPHCLEILERIHARAPEELTNLTTNGSCLTEDVVARSARLRPILVTVSMNAASLETRLVSMRDRKREGAATALACVPLLRKYDLPFILSYVPWPSKPLSDLEDLVRLAERYDAVVARVCMPSWTRHSAREAPFDTAAYWSEILDVVERMRREVTIPIHLMPNMYELRTMRPVVQGTIKYSPAARAGFQYDDLIVAVAGEQVFTRPEVSRYLIHRLDDPALSSTRFTVERAGRRVDIEIRHPRDVSELEYPYRWLARRGDSRTWAGSLGLHMADGIELTSFMHLKDIVEEYAGRRVLLFISELGEPHFFEGMAMLGPVAAFIDRVEFYVQKLRPRYWGGNVMIGDLWTAHDIIEQTESWIERQGIRPDVIVVPSSFLSRGGRDLTGACYIQAERALDIEVRLLPCQCIGL